MRTVLFVMLTGWAIAFFGSFLVYYLMTTTEPGVYDTQLNQDLSKLSRFLVWQVVAIVLAVLCLFLRWSTKDSVERRLAAIPSMSFGVLVLITGSMVLVTNLKAGAETSALGSPNTVAVPVKN